MEPLFRVNEQGQLEEAVFQVADEAALQQELDQLQNAFNQASDAHATAVQAVTEAQTVADAAAAHKEAAQTALTKSEARSLAARQARELSNQEPGTEQVAGVDTSTPDESGTHTQNVGSQEQSVPVTVLAAE